jgi:Ser/Thr protein kinase RdoA (MazF antagonist)
VVARQEAAQVAGGAGDQDGRLGVLRSVLAPSALAAAVGRAYGLLPTGCVLQRSFTNDVYLLDVGGKGYVAKVYGPGWRTAADLAYEIELLAHLDACGVPVATAVPGRDGGLVRSLSLPEGERYLVLFTLAPGAEPVEPFTPALYSRFGQAAAALHRAADSFVSAQPRAPLDLTRLLDRPLAAIRLCLGHRSADWAYLCDLAERVRARMVEFAAAGLDWGPCHGDLTLDCFRITEEGRITLYDFDSGGPGWRAMEFQGMYAHAPRENWEAFRVAYTQVRPLGEVDLDALPWCVPLYAFFHMGWAAGDWATWSGRWRVDDRFWAEQLAWLRRWDGAHLDRDFVP